MASVYEIVTNRIVEELEKGRIPWRKPWSSIGGYAVSWKTQEAYKGINQWMLEPGEYATFKQINEVGGKVKKGEKSRIVVFWKMVEKEEKNKDGEMVKETIPLLRYYKVFEINTQCEGLKSRRKQEEGYRNNPIEVAESIIENYKDCPVIRFAPGRAFYRPSQDIISVPEIKDYKVKEEYYCTLYHELIHSTGHVSRLNRDGITSHAATFGSETYSKEELIAEIGASFVCRHVGIDNHTFTNSVAYIQSWLKALKDNKRMIITAASKAEKAAKYILGA